MGTGAMPTDTKTWNGVDLWRLDDPKSLKALLNAEPQNETVDKHVPEKRNEAKDTQEQAKDGGGQ